jgi:amino acid adenylation domain-containing protein
MPNNVFQIELNESLKKFRDTTAIEYGDNSLSYSELDRRANCIARWILRKNIEKETFIGVLAGNRTDYITSILGILKAGCAFVPLDPANPVERIAKMIDTIQLSVVFIDRYYGEFSMSPGMKDKNTEFVFLEDVFSNRTACDSLARTGLEYTAEDKIYVYFTSGTTGKPQAIIGKSKSLLHYIKWEIDTFEINEKYRVSQFATTSDAFLKEIFVTLLSGGTLCIPADFKAILNFEDLRDWIERSRIVMVHCVPHVFRLLSSEKLSEVNFPALKYLVLSGEKVFPSDLECWYDKLGERIQLINLYGTTETTILNTCYFITKADVHRKRIPVGKPRRGNRVIILDENMNVCNTGIIGEIYIRTPFSTFGYYNNPLLNEKKFIPNPFNNNPDDLIFKTGDLGRFLPDGNIDLLGRSDRQVKVRGHRIELEEIEHVLMKHPHVKDVVVTRKELSANNELLFAYFVRDELCNAGKGVLEQDLTEYLSGKLPDYMIPNFFQKMEQIPRKPNRKVEYDLLPDPLKSNEIEYIPPGNEIEIRLAAIWSEIIKINPIGRNHNFFRIGGHSLNMMALTYRIHKEFGVRIPFEKIFDNPLLKKQAAIISASVKEEYTSPIPVEAMDYYMLSPQQERLYVMQQMNLNNTNYNMSVRVVLQGKPDRDKLAYVFKSLLNRHESLRTFFRVVNDNPVQRICRDIDFNVEYYTANPGTSSGAAEIVDEFVRPFDLSAPPLLRAGLVKVEEEKHILLVDMHHTISDGISLEIIMREFMALYSGKKLPALKIQYRDYSQWENKRKKSGDIKQQEEYWLKEFSGEIPRLILPMDFARPAEQHFEGSWVKFELSGADSQDLKKFASAENMTPFMLLLAVYNILLAKISNTEDVLIGVPVSGRNHGDLEPLAGMFVNMIVLRSFPVREMTMADFLSETKIRTLKAFENQDYQFEDLVRKLAIKRDLGRNPLFDVIFVMHHVEDPGLEIPGLKLEVDLYETGTSKYDLGLNVRETEGNFSFIFEYDTRLFKKETIERYVGYFKEILSFVSENKEARLKDIRISHKLRARKPRGAGVEFGFQNI